MEQQNPIMLAPNTFNGIVDTAVATCARYRSGDLDPQYYGNYSGTVAAVADTLRIAVAKIETLTILFGNDKTN